MSHNSKTSELTQLRVSLDSKMYSECETNSRGITPRCKKDEPSTHDHRSAVNKQFIPTFQIAEEDPTPLSRSDDFRSIKSESPLKSEAVAFTRYESA